MKVVGLTLLSAAAGAEGKSQANPLGAVTSLLDELTAKITKEGEVEAKAYAEYVEWCDDVSKNGAFAIETATKEKAKLEATISELTGSIQTAGSKIDDLVTGIATAEKNLKDSNDIRQKENADFLSGEHELVESIDALTRAVTILEREMSKNPAAFAQVAGSSMAATVKAFGAVLDAAAFSSSDQKKLSALIQSQNADTDDDAEFGAPAAAAYKTRSTNILDVLEDLKEKAEGQLSDLRKAEVNTRHNFEMLKQSLEDESAANTKDMEEEKAGRAADAEGKAAAEGDLSMTVKELANAKDQKETAQTSCLRTASDHESTVAARQEELKVIAQARQVLSETTSGAESQTYSLLQSVSLSSTATSVRLQTRADLAGREVIEIVRRLAKEQHSSALAQLASRISAVARFGAANGEDVFGKVKGLIQDMIAKLEKEAGSEATEKAYCDEQIAKTEAKKGELEDDIAKMTSRIDQSAAKSAQLKAQVQELESQLANLARSQAEMDKMRMEAHAEYGVAKADLELGLSGVRKALGLLRDYYGGAAAMLQSDTKSDAFMQQPAAPELHGKAGGAGGSIISILEVVESDFATNLAKEETAEADAQAEHEKVSQENAITKTVKDQDVKYKTQEAKSLDSTVAEYSSDRETANTELSAVLDFYSKIKERCIAKPETYETRAQRREAEIKGLKEALSILEDETALVQRKRRGSFRGSLAM